MSKKIKIRITIHYHGDDHLKKDKKQNADPDNAIAKMLMVSALVDQFERLHKERKAMWDAAAADNANKVAENANKVAENANKVADNANTVADSADSNSNEIHPNADEEPIVKKTETSVPERETSYIKSETPDPKNETLVRKTKSTTGRTQNPKKSGRREKKCTICGKSYTPTGNAQRFCTDCKEQRDELSPKDLQDIADLDPKPVPNAQATKPATNDIDNVMKEIDERRKKPYTISH